MDTQVTRYKFNTAQYSMMGEAGILPEGSGIELHGGFVWDVSPLVRNRCHPLLNGGVTRFLNEQLGWPKEYDAHIHKFTAAEYHVMGDTGVLTRDDRVELIEGEIVLMPPMLSPHASILDRLTRLFTRLLPEEQAVVRVQGPISLPNDQEPEPDLLLLRPRADFYYQAHPMPQDVLLALEVSESTLRYDRAVKAPLYALHRIPEYWIVNIPGQAIEVHRNPDLGAYQETTVLTHGLMLTPQAFPHLSIPASDILSPQL